VEVAVAVNAKFVREGCAAGVDPTGEEGIYVDVLTAEAAGAAVDDGGGANAGGGAEAGAVRLEAELVSGGEMETELEEVDGLVGSAGDDAGEAVDVG